MLKKLIVFFSMLFLMACNSGVNNGSSGTVDDPVNPDVLSSIEINSSGSTSLPVGVSVQMVATGVYTNGIRKDITSLVKWGVSGDAIRIDDSGMITTLRSTGKSEPVIITASLGDKISAPLTISIKAEDVRLLRLVINSTGSLDLAKNSIIQFQAVGSYSDGSSLDLTNSVNWEVNDNSILSVATNGKGTALAVGAVNITASFDSVTSNSLTVNVKDITLKNIEINIDDSTLVAGTSGKLTATGHYSDGSIQQLTNQVSWTSSNNTIVNVTANGIANANKAGSANVTASLSGITSNSLPVTVRAATLKSIEINIDDSTLVAGTSGKLTATGHYSDGSIQQLTNQVSWTSSNNTIVNVTANGIANANKAGSANVTASLSGITSNSLPVTVRAATLKSLAISAASSTIIKGLSTELTAVATYSDNTTQIVTKEVSWISSDSNIASVSATGKVSANNTGKANIKATYGTISSNEITLEVTRATINSLEISITDSTLVASTSSPLKAIAHLSNNTTEDVTMQVTWWNTGSNSKYVMIDKDTAILYANSTNNEIQVKFHASIRVNDYIQSNDLTVTVLPRAPVKSVEISAVDSSGEPITRKIFPGSTFYIKAKEIFDNQNNTTQDVTHEATWSNSNEQIVKLIDQRLGKFQAMNTDGTSNIRARIIVPDNVSSNILAITVGLPL